ncbi:MAG: endolytic transglycosylase MltG [Xanthomonadales bacterium]|nr:endolytic transglycosylase MltG [Xanthomonadales bacterium]
MLLLLLAGAALSWQAWRQYEAFLADPLELPPDGYVFMLEPGSNGKSIISELTARGFTRQGWHWKLLMRLEPAVYRAGEYHLPAGLTPRKLLQKLSSGEVVQYRFTLVEGWTFRQLVAALTADEVLEHELDLEQPYLWDPGTLFEGMQHPEGWFLPETYQFTRGHSDRDILERAHVAMAIALEEAWASRDVGLPMNSPYELLVLASIIEKETALEEERGRIAGVFVRRLQKRMRLQTDPTVIYGMGESWDGDIKRSDLKTDTPYNTYTRHGLPPTPIAMPGRASLLAAAHPEAGEELFFVANGNGGHTFSKTLAEHQAAVDKLLGRN